jgi:hypothetical protein
MQIKNSSEETIVLRPGECISGDSTVRRFNNKTFRIEMERVNKGPLDSSEFTTPIERHMEKYEE